MRENLVECYSGHIYAERPKAFYQGGEKLEVAAVEAQWRSPDGFHFQVRTKSGSIFELIYNNANSSWQVREA